MSLQCYVRNPKSHKKVIEPIFLEKSVTKNLTKQYQNPKKIT